MFLTYGCRNHVAILNKFDTNGTSTFSLKKNALADRVFILMLVYRRQSMNTQQFFQIFFRYLLTTYPIDITKQIKSHKIKFWDNFTDYAQMVNKPTHITGSLIEHVYIKEALMEKLFTNVTVENIFFLDHDAVRIVIEKNSVVFHINPWNLIYVTIIVRLLLVTFGSKTKKCSE